jgi:hypothetical protein
VEKHQSTRQAMLSAAHEHLNMAIDLLDRADAPAQIGARIDQARHELEQAIEAAKARVTDTSSDPPDREGPPV